jgi:hypothetical protein
MTDIFDEIATSAWEQSKTRLEQMWIDLAPEPPPPRSTFRVKDRRTGLWAVCRLCGAENKWTPENEPVTVFVCEHEPIWVGWGSLRQVDSIALKYVDEVEEVEK